MIHLCVSKHILDIIWKPIETNQISKMEETQSFCCSQSHIAKVQSCDLYGVAGHKATGLNNTLDLFGWAMDRLVEMRRNLYLHCILLLNYVKFNLEFLQDINDDINALPQISHISNLKETLHINSSLQWWNSCDKWKCIKLRSRWLHLRLTLWFHYPKNLGSPLPDGAPKMAGIWISVAL